MIRPDYEKVYEKISNGLSARQKEVLERRFGIKKFSKRETLQSIGDSFGVSRERIRQIEKVAFDNLIAKVHSPEVQEISRFFKQYFTRQGGFKRESFALEDLGGDKLQNCVYLFLKLCGFYRFAGTEEYYSFWAQDKGYQEIVKKILLSLQRLFEKKKKSLSKEELFKLLPQFSHAQIMLSLEISRKIEKGIDGLYGLTTWPTVLPKRARDKIYLALKKAQKPLHFTEIAKLGNEITAQLAYTGKKVLPQTVHNELIRDDRFVLVGRGIYALKEWGYMPGTVHDVLVRILKKQKKGMPLDALLKSVKKQRTVKDSTILLALSDRNYFLKDDNGRYKIREI